MLNTKNDDYTGDDILVLNDVEAIRKNPGMYIGELDVPNHLFYEVLNNAIDEHIMNFGNKIKIKFIDTNIVSIRDYGRGIPFDKFNDKFLACEVIFLKNHSGGKFKTSVYQHSGGLHGVGLVAVNSLSEWLNVHIYRNDKKHEMQFEYGVLKTSKTTDNVDNEDNGTHITFKPDIKIFKSNSFNIDVLHTRLTHIAALNTTLVLSVNLDNIKLESLEIHCPNGIYALMDNTIKNPILKKHIVCKFSDEQYKYSVVINWCDDISGEKYIAFTNCIVQPDGGSHVIGIRNGILDFFNINKIFHHITNKDIQYSDIRHGIHFIINLSMQSPSFSSQEKVKLISSNIKIHITNVLSKYLTSLYNESDVLSVIIKKISKYLISKYQKNNTPQLSAMLLNGALFDCYTKDRSEAELFIAEGESAAGIVKPVMDRKTQAVLSIRGKILNVEKANIGQILGSDKLFSIIKAIGGFIDQNNNLNLDNLRYGRIIILADADVDGDHIRALVLTLFHKYAIDLINEQKLYVAVPPLYKLQMLNHNQYFNTSEDLIEFIVTNIQSVIVKKKITIQQRETLKGWINVIYNKGWDIEFDNYIAYLIDFIILHKVISYEMLLSLIDMLIESIKHISLTIEIFVNNKNELIIENYTNLQKKTFTKKFILKIIDKLSSIDFNEHFILQQNMTNENNMIKLMFDYIQNFKAKTMIQRFKGLGEMNKDQIYETVINKSNRILKLVTIADFEQSKKIRNILMGSIIAPRKEFINNYLEKHIRKKTKDN